MNRRRALSLLASLPFARLAAQTRSSPRHRVALSVTHGLLLHPDGALSTWSKDPGGGEGQVAASNALGLGHNDTVSQHRLYPVPGLTDVIAIAAAPGTSFAVLGDGRLLAWGTSARGRLGTTPLAEFEDRAQPRASSPTPAPVAVRFEAVDVSCKGDHTLALARDGSVYAWGYGTSGQLGIGALPIVNFKTRSASAMPEVPYPVRVSDLQGAIAIGAGNQHSLALLKDGTVWAWGENKLGQIGDGTLVNRDKPVRVAGVEGAVAIAAGGYCSVAVLPDGRVMEWGSNIRGDQSARPTPALVAGARDVRSVVAGDAHVVALTSASDVVTWGNTSHYEVGRGPKASPAPGIVNGIAGVRSVGAAHSTTIAVLGDGRMMVWGEVRKRDGSLSPRPIPLSLDGLEQP